MFHPFYVRHTDQESGGSAYDGEWKAASNLLAGDVLQKIDGSTVYVTEVTVEKLPKIINVYNLEIEDLHTYYVADGVLVHNNCNENDKSPNVDEGGSGYYQDANGQWHRPNGQFASNAEVGLPSASDHYLHRPYIRKGTIDGVNANTKVNYKTGQIYDSISGKWVDPTNVELGNKQGYEFWRMRDWAEAQGMTQAEFNEFMNNSDFYGWQDITSNRSHAYEQH